jgi:hypothetical protein
LVGGVCLVILAADLADLHDKHLAVRWGIVVDMAGAALLIVISSMLIWQAPRRRRFLPPDGGPHLSTAGGALAAPPPMTSRPADWYPDPHGEARLRYWDGARWTEHTAP